MIVRMDVPIISFAVYPKRRSAPLFQLVTVPLRSLLTMASSELSTMDARRRAALILEVGFSGRSDGGTASSIGRSQVGATRTPNSTRGDPFLISCKTQPLD